MPINKRGNAPAYAQLADLLRQQIEDESLPDGYELPSLPTLIDEHGVSISVVRQALQQLESEGLITTRQGKGSTVRRPKRHLRDGTTRYLRSRRGAGKAALEAEAESQGQERKKRSLEVGNVAAPSHVAGMLGVRPGDSVLRRRYIFDLDQTPAEIVCSYFRHELAAGTPLTEPNEVPGGVHNLLAEQLGLDLAEAVEVLYARMPTPQETRELRLLPGTPVVEMTRTFLTRDGQCVEVSVWVFAGDRHEFKYGTLMD